MDLDDHQERERNVELTRTLSRAFNVPTISYYDLEFDQSFESRLGEGSNGVVFKAFWNKSDSERIPVAVKFIKLDERLDVEAARRQQEQALEHEAGLQTVLDHDNLVKLLGICVAPTLILVLELCNYGSIRSLLNMATSSSAAKTQLQLKVFSPRNRCNWALQIARALAHLHQQNIIHRDIRADNVFVSDSGIAKLGDFEYSRLTSGASYTSKGGGPTQARWLAPELCSADAIKLWTNKADIYSYGVLLWELLTFRAPYDDKRDLEVIVGRCFGSLESPKMPCLREIPGGLFNSLLDYTELMLQCLAIDPQHRPNADEIVTRMEQIVEHSVGIRPVAPASRSMPSDATPTTSPPLSDPTTPTPRPPASVNPTAPPTPPASTQHLDTPKPTGTPTASDPAPPAMNGNSTEPMARPAVHHTAKQATDEAQDKGESSTPQHERLPSDEAMSPWLSLKSEGSGKSETKTEASGLSGSSVIWGTTSEILPSGSGRSGNKSWRSSKVYQSWQKVKAENRAVEGVWEFWKNVHRDPPGTFRSTVDYLTEYITKAGPNYMAQDPGYCITTPALGADLGETFYAYNSSVKLHTLNLYMTVDRLRAIEAVFSNSTFLVRGLSQQKLTKDPKRYRKYRVDFKDRKATSVKMHVRVGIGIATKITGLEIGFEGGEAFSCAVESEDHRADSEVHHSFGCELGSGVCCGVYGKSDVNNVTALGFAFLR